MAKDLVDAMFIVIVDFVKFNRLATIQRRTCPFDTPNFGQRDGFAANN
jgi:hypothetical protein